MVRDQYAKAARDYWIPFWFQVLYRRRQYSSSLLKAFEADPCQKPCAFLFSKVVFFHLLVTANVIPSSFKKWCLNKDSSCEFFCLFLLTLFILLKTSLIKTALLR